MVMLALTVLIFTTERWRRKRQYAWGYFPNIVQAQRLVAQVLSREKKGCRLALLTSTIAPESPRRQCIGCAVLSIAIFRRFSCCNNPVAINSEN